MSGMGIWTLNIDMNYIKNTPSFDVTRRKGTSCHFGFRTDCTYIMINSSSSHEIKKFHFIKRIMSYSTMPQMARIRRTEHVCTVLFTTEL